MEMKDKDTIVIEVKAAQIVSAILQQLAEEDVVQVVRCKDCVYSKPFHAEWFQPYMPNMLWCSKYARKKPNWFCADGERREE